MMSSPCCIAPLFLPFVTAERTTHLGINRHHNYQDTNSAFLSFTYNTMAADSTFAQILRRLVESGEWEKSVFLSIAIYFLMQLHLGCRKHLPHGSTKVAFLTISNTRQRVSALGASSRIPEWNE